MRFGIVTVTSYLGKQGIKAYWAYRCDCGVEGKTSSTNMKIKKSCGCLHKTWMSGMRTSHGETKFGKRSNEYSTWAGMIKRCTKPNTPHYEKYGGRGITVCSRWLESIENFIEDMGRKPGPEYSLDRIDNDGPYSPENCRWATWTEQQRNRTGCHFLFWNKEKITVQEACDRAGLKDVTVHARVRRGWTWEAALTTPINGSKKVRAKIKDIGTIKREPVQHGL